MRAVRHILVVAALLASTAAWGGEPKARGYGRGEPSRGRSPAQRRLLAERAARVRAARDGLQELQGLPPGAPVRGRVRIVKELEKTREPDGSVHVELEVAPGGKGPTRPRRLPGQRGRILRQMEEHTTRWLRRCDQLEREMTIWEEALGEPAEDVREDILRRQEALFNRTLRQMARLEARLERTVHE